MWHYFSSKRHVYQRRKDVLFTVMNRRAIPDLQKYIFQIDPEAFITIADAHEILGKGFKSLQEKIN